MSWQKSRHVQEAYQYTNNTSTPEEILNETDFAHNGIGHPRQREGWSPVRGGKPAGNRTNLNFQESFDSGEDQASPIQLEWRAATNQRTSW